MSEEQSIWRLFLYLILAVFAVSTSAILIRLTQTSPIVIAFYRQAFSAVMILPFLNREPETVLSRRSYILLVLSGLFLAIHFATWITGLQYTSVARATLFVDLQPIWAVILGRIFLKETLSLLEVFAVALVTAGGILTVGWQWGDAGTGRFGDILAACGGVAGACYLLIGRKVRAEISWLRYMYSVYYLSAIWLLLFHILLYRRFPVPIEQDLIWIIAMALVPSILGHGLFNVVIRHMKAYIVNAAFLGEPVLAAALAYLIFGEAPDRAYYFGAVIIFSGLFILFLRQRR
ncbi:MAG TPA: DMT family transporter [Acidobacteriota bacterium]|nr:DMT family transporter [Acidobacteriota bacterium]